MNKVLPPKLRDLNIWTVESNPREEKVGNEVWEIAVPIKNSLPWSIVLSYLFSAGDNDFSVFLRKLIGENEEVKEIKTKKKLSLDEIDDKRVKRRLESFNPFKNRHVFFNQCKEVIEIFRIFDLRLNRYGNSLKKKGDNWNDDFKLNAASRLLECVIEVYFPEAENKKNIVYPKTAHNFKSKIVLFQYENQKHGARKENINVFHFSVTLEQAHSLKLDALDHVLKKAKLPKEKIQKVKELMKHRKNHGKCFLPTIFQNGLCDILPNIYKSPYIAVKLSEAGFHTDPTSTCSGEPSPLCYALLFSTDLNHVRILYDYASNCRNMFDRSVRSADEDLLNNMKRITAVMENDISFLHPFQFQRQSKERASDILKQFILFSKYQFETASHLTSLRNQPNMTDFEFRKQVINSILNGYLKNVFHKSLDVASLFDVLVDYATFSEYYKNVDNFAYTSFFDNFYKLKVCLNFKNESSLLNIEWTMFLALISNRHFSKFDHEKNCTSEWDKQKCEDDYVLQYIPLLYRNKVQSEIRVLLEKLENAADDKALHQALKLPNDQNLLPQVTDDLIMSRLMMHIDSALEVSPSVDGIRAVLVIERTLQVVGESIKPPSSNQSSVSYLLRSWFPDSLQKILINIRNNISHHVSNSVHGRLTVEKDLKLFDSIRKELEQIKTSFKIVDFSQLLRVEETVMYSFYKEFGSELRQEEKEAFYKNYELLINERKNEYKKYHDQCVQLMWFSTVALQNYSNFERSTENVLLGWLKSIEFLLQFILRLNDEHTLVTFLNDIKQFIENCNDNKIDNFHTELSSLLQNHIDAKTMPTRFVNTTSVSSIEHFFHSLKKNIFLDDEKDSIRKVIVNTYEEAQDARKKLENLFTKRKKDENLEEYLKKVLIPKDKVDKLRSAYEINIRNEKSKEAKEALKCLSKEYLSEEKLDHDVRKILCVKKMEEVNLEDEKSFDISPYTILLLTKIVYQRYLSYNIYTPVKLSENAFIKLEQFLMKKVELLITRLNTLKSILLDEDEEIKETWTWGRSKEIKYHMKLLMCQRYMREVTVRDSLDMIFFDCVNVLNKSSLKVLYEKSTNLFAGVSLRNVVAHRTNIESIGFMLDKEDFPSAMIEKMLILIDDSEAIESIRKLFPKFGGLTEESFKSWIEKAEPKYTKEIKAIKDCQRWEEYLYLFPFIKI